MDRYGDLFPDEMDRLAEGLDTVYRVATDNAERGARRSTVVHLHSQPLSEGDAGGSLRRRGVSD